MMVDLGCPGARRAMTLWTLPLCVLTTLAMPSLAIADENRPDDRPDASNAVSIEPKVEAQIEGQKVLSIVHAVVAPGRTEPRHTHPGLEIIYVLTGSGRIDIDGRMSELGAGAIVHVPAGAAKAMTNTSRTHTLEVLAVLVLEPGTPPVAIID